MKLDHLRRIDLTRRDGHRHLENGGSQGVRRLNHGVAARERDQHAQILRQARDAIPPSQTPCILCEGKERTEPGAVDVFGPGAIDHDSDGGRLQLTAHIVAKRAARADDQGARRRHDDDVALTSECALVVIIAVYFTRRVAAIQGEIRHATRYGDMGSMRSPIGNSNVTNSPLHSRPVIRVGMIRGMPPVAAHFISLLLAMLDVAARGWRYSLLVRGVRAHLSFRGGLVLTLFGDAVGAVTPMRLGGEPARILGARHDGVPVSRALLALGLENVLTYLILIPAAAFVATRYGEDWWRSIAPRLDWNLVRWVVAATLVLIVLGAIFLVRRRPAESDAAPSGASDLRKLIGDLLAFPLPLLALCAVMSAVSLVARVAILPVLISSTPNPPSLGVSVVASLGLLYGQLVVPTPSGVGPIDVAVLAGAAGVDSAAATVLGAWRLYTTILPVAVGFIAGSLAYGRAILSLLPRR